MKQIAGDVQCIKAMKDMCRALNINDYERVTMFLQVLKNNKISHSDECVHSKYETLAQCWASIVDCGPTLKQHWVNVSQWLNLKPALGQRPVFVAYMLCKNIQYIKYITITEIILISCSIIH